MSAPELDTITITDFRSIRGTLAVPLTAPVVLIHGTMAQGSRP
jgi:DNA repair protein SbcC/Rad50